MIMIADVLCALVLPRVGSKAEGSLVVAADECRSGLRVASVLHISLRVLFWPQKSVQQRP